VLVCPPLTCRILPSVTRSVVIDIALGESIKVETRPCREAELFNFDEIMMLSTAVEIVPITAVSGRKIQRGSGGPITRRLQRAFQASIHVGYARTGNQAPRSQDQIPYEK